MHWSPDCLNTGMNLVALVCYIPLLFSITSVQLFSLRKMGVGWGGGGGYTCMYMCSVSVGEAYFYLHGR